MNVVSPELATDSVVRQLIDGIHTEDIVVYDVSDRRLYGRSRLRRLTGELAQAAEAAGCRPEVYQSVYWLTLAYFPVKPLGTFLVLPRQTCDDSDSDAEQYRAIRIPSDWRQVGVHYAIAFAIVLGLICGVVAWQVSQ
jgi:hypothetical protein